MKKINKSNSDSKKGYNKPKVRTIELRYVVSLLAGSAGGGAGNGDGACETPAPTAPIWGGEGN